MNLKPIGVICGLLILALGAACASQPSLATNTAASPQTLPEQGAEPGAEPGQAAQPTLALGQPTPTPETKPPDDGDTLNPQLVQTLPTAPYSVILNTASLGAINARYYPAPQTSPRVMLLLAAAGENDAWTLLAQTAQVRGAAALVLDLPAPGDAPGAALEAAETALAWLSALDSRQPLQILISGSGPGAGPVLAVFNQKPDLQAALLFSPQTADPGFQADLDAAADRPLLVVQSSADTAPVQAGSNREVLAFNSQTSGVNLLTEQAGLLNQVLDWWQGLNKD